MESMNNFRPEGCPLVYKVYKERKANPETFALFEDLTYPSRGPVGRALGLTDDFVNELSFVDFNYFTDVLTCKQFENHQMDDSELTEELWLLIHKIQAIY